MTRPEQSRRLLTVEEYLERENRSSRKHEYVAGRVYAMSGVKIRHNQISRNFILRLGAAAGDGPCQVLFNDVKLRAAHEKIYYPDVMVLCRPLDAEAYVVSDPCLVVEVISPSTRRVDYGEKLDAYRDSRTLQTYLIAEQSSRLVERYWRDEAGAWQHATVTDTSGGAIPVPCPEVSLTLDEIYRGVDAPPYEEPRRGTLRRVRERAPA